MISKEDIISLGYKKVIHEGTFQGNKFIPDPDSEWFGKDGKHLIGLLQDNIVVIKKLSGVCFEGRVENKIELETLIKQTGI